MITNITQNSYNNVYFKASNRKPYVQPMSVNEPLQEASAPKKKHNVLKYLAIGFATLCAGLLFKNNHKSASEPLAKCKYASHIPNSVKDTGKDIIKDVARVAKSRKKTGLKALKKELKTYMKGIKAGDKVDPSELERIFIEAGAQDVTAAEKISFIPTAEYPVGKKKKFILDGKSYIIETHNGKGPMDTITRVYEEGAKKERNYLNKDGTFENDSYFSAFSHLFSGLCGFNWIGH